MKAEALPLLKLIGSSPQLTIPIDQPTFSWTIKHCEQLWNDILRVGAQAVRIHLGRAWRAVIVARYRRRR